MAAEAFPLVAQQLFFCHDQPEGWLHWLLNQHVG
jgi:hypothetical protein